MNATPARFGDLVFDLAHGCIRDREIADDIIRETLSQARKRARTRAPDKYERLWILKLLWLNLADHLRLNRETHPNEFVLDMTPTHVQRVVAFDGFFLRLPVEDRFALGAAFGHGIEFSEIATALQVTEGGLAVRLEQALRWLEEWLWDFPQKDSQADCFQHRRTMPGVLAEKIAPHALADFESHLAQCADCKMRLDHYREIVEVIRKQPRKSMPAEFLSAQSAPASPTKDRLSHWSIVARSFWMQTPWLIRTALEGASIVLVVLLGVSAGPKLRHLYERDLDQAFAEFTEAFFKRGSKDDANLALTRGRSDQVEGAPGSLTRADDFLDDAAQETGESGGDEAGYEADEGEADAAGAGSASGKTSSTESRPEEIVALSGEIWRFNLKTDSPRDFRTQIVDLLLDLKLPKNTPGIGGTEAPGGIQFDLIVAPELVVQIKNKLEEVAPAPPAGTSTQSPMSEPFTWYKNRSRRAITPGKSRVVIWLSQI